VCVSVFNDPKTIKQQQPQEKKEEKINLACKYNKYIQQNKQQTTTKTNN